ncbi:hypothetical protein EHW66_18755 [Erwinia psidii]|uniref:Uncharacterized protein n=1 Tax=Erwinia psidii TaxID=69224 RepID=A0A3N6TS40_9GAMM|nr:hypothetical protein [Erwinia psidii]MCX8963430.1 hypothetical protein [Erwinia psidii]MCX8966944.1 hypothetical protein [Erwinia psidii]RQM38062.1 hypothetical protein EB241_12360 [Erwinia psidii]
MLSKTGFTHSDLLRWQNEYAGRSLNVNGTIMRDIYTVPTGENLRTFCLANSRWAYRLAAITPLYG